MKLTPTSLGNEYKNIMFELINNLKMAHHKPDDPVVQQNDPVLDEEKDFLSGANVYFIMTGNYKVQSLMFEMQHKTDAMQQAEDAPGEVDEEHLMSKNLRSGDMFGEVSLIFGCRRTATVKAKQYCECAYLENKEFHQLMNAHPVVKQYLIKNILNSYDDELRIFLVTCLKEIDYLAKQPEETLVHLSMTMVAMQNDKDSYLYNADDCFNKRGTDKMIIVYAGKLVYQVRIDDKTEINLDNLEKGSILDAHNFLVGRPAQASVKCLSAVTYYYLTYETMKELSQIYPELKSALNASQKKAKYDKMMDINAMDY